jgi:hypothetical protein
MVKHIALSRASRECDVHTLDPTLICGAALHADICRRRAILAHLDDRQAGNNIRAALAERGDARCD